MAGPDVIQPRAAQLILPLEIWMSIIERVVDIDIKDILPCLAPDPLSCDYTKNDYATILSLKEVIAARLLLTRVSKVFHDCGQKIVYETIFIRSYQRLFEFALALETEKSAAFRESIAKWTKCLYILIPITDDFDEAVEVLTPIAVAARERGEDVSATDVAERTMTRFLGHFKSLRHQILDFGFVNDLALDGMFDGDGHTQRDAWPHAGSGMHSILRAPGELQSLRANFLPSYNHAFTKLHTLQAPWMVIARLVSAETMPALRTLIVDQQIWPVSSYLRAATLPMFFAKHGAHLTTVIIRAFRRSISLRNLVGGCPNLRDLAVYADQLFDIPARDFPIGRVQRIVVMAPMAFEEPAPEAYWTFVFKAGNFPDLRKVRVSEKRMHYFGTLVGALKAGRIETDFVLEDSQGRPILFGNGQTGDAQETCVAEDSSPSVSDVAA